MRVRFPSPAPARWLCSIYCSSSCYLMRPTGRYDAQAVFPLVKYDLRTELCRHEGLVGLPVVLPKVPAALKLVMHTRFRRPLHRRSLHRDVPRHPNGHDPHWLQGFPDRVTPPAPSGPGWRHRRRDRPQRRACTALRDTRAPPGPAARRVGDPVRRSARGGAAHRAGGRNTRQGPRMRHRAGQ